MGDRKAAEITATLPLPVTHVGLGWCREAPGGLERYQDELCRASASLLATGSGGSGVQAVQAWVLARGDVDRNPGYTLRAYASPEGSRRSRAGSLRQHWLEQRNNAKGPGLLVTHHASSAEALLSGSKAEPHVVHFHGPWASESAASGAPAWKTMLQRRLERRVYRRADRVITLSNAFRHVVQEAYGVDPSVVRVVPGGIHAERYASGETREEAREVLGWAAGRPTVFCLRRLVPRMGLDALLHAVGLLVERVPDVQVMIGGSGPERSALEAQIRGLGLRGQVRLLGFVPDEHLALAYRAAELSVVPTRALEGFGLVCLESLASGTPVLVTPVGGLPEVVAGLDPALVMPSSEPGDMADAMARALLHPQTLPSAQRCERHVRENFDWSVIAPQVLEVYAEAVAAWAGRSE